VAVSVADDGAGMPAELVAAPFEPMRRRRRARTAGAGLGLSIAKGIVAAHGGRIELEQAGAGTRFAISLPVERISGTALANGKAAAHNASLAGIAAAPGRTALEGAAATPAIEPASANGQGNRRP
jgi:hypothetical protein